MFSGILAPNTPVVELYVKADATSTLIALLALVVVKYKLFVPSPAPGDVSPTLLSVPSES